MLERLVGSRVIWQTQANVRIRSNRGECIRDNGLHKALTTIASWHTWENGARYFDSRENRFVSIKKRIDCGKCYLYITGALTSCLKRKVFTKTFSSKLYDRKILEIEKLLYKCARYTIESRQVER